MLTIVIILILAIGVYTGARRGLVLQLVYTGGYVLSFICARLFYRDVAAHLELLVPYPMPTPDSQLVFFPAKLLFKLDQAFYAGVAFLLILLIGWLATRFIGMLCHRLTFFPVLHQTNLIGGGLLGGSIAYIGLFLLLFVVAMLPIARIQGMFQNSALARMMVEYTPYFSKQIYQWWVTTMIH